MRRLNKFYTKAFTLVEVLITLGIIGIVAAIIIPVAISNAEQQQHISTWRKTYSTLMQAVQQMTTDNGGNLTLAIPFDSSGVTDNYKSFLDSFRPYLKSIKTCNVGSVVSGGCYSGTFKALSDSYTITNYAAATSAMVLNNGVVLFFYPGSLGSCTQNVICSDTHIFIDVSGSKPPNRLGKDIFYINYNTTKKIFMNGPYPTKACSAHGWNCSEYYLIYD